MLKETVQRLQSETPDYWKKIRAIGIGVITAAGVIVALPAAGLSVPVAILVGAKYAIAIGATLGLSAQATTK